MSMSLALIFLIVGVCCKQVYEVVEREQTPQQSSGYKELDENINYKWLIKSITHSSFNLSPQAMRSNL